MNELKHYGVLGMHWGVRRYQNKDGTRTAAGKKHAKESKIRNATVPGKKNYKSRKDLDSMSKTQAKKRVLETRSSRQLYRNADLFSTQELRTAYNRLLLEKNIRDLDLTNYRNGQRAIRGYDDYTKITDKSIKYGKMIAGH